MGRFDFDLCPICRGRTPEGVRCKRRQCPGYVGTYLRDQRAVLVAGLGEWSGRTCLLTLTAPGADRLPWDQSRCCHGPAVKCSGVHGCKVIERAAAEWNDGLTKRLSDLLDAARERTARVHGREHGSQVVVLAYVLEAHRRGVLHVHLVLGYGGSAADRAALETFRRAVGKRRHRYRFGSNFNAGQPDRFSGRDAARYIGKYLRPDGAKESFLPLLAAVEAITPRRRDRRGVARLARQLRPVFVNPKLTRASGVTIRSRRFCRHAHRVDFGLTNDLLLALWRNFGPLQLVSDDAGGWNIVQVPKRPSWDLVHEWPEDLSPPAVVVRSWADPRGRWRRDGANVRWRDQLEACS